MPKWIQTKWIQTQHIRSYWPFVRACLGWLVQTTVYAWIAPWVLLAICLTLFRPSAPSIREFVINLATAERSDWSQLPEIWMTTSLVVGAFVVASRIPSSPIWFLIEEKLLDPLAKRIQHAWERLSFPTRASLKYATAAFVVGTISLSVVIHWRHSEPLQDISLPRLPVSPTPSAAAALVLADGSLLSGTAEVSRQANSSYVIRFLEHKKDTHE